MNVTSTLRGQACKRSAANTKGPASARSAGLQPCNVTVAVARPENVGLQTAGHASNCWQPPPHPTELLLNGEACRQATGTKRERCEDVMAWTPDWTGTT